jgi:hypothetical protein
MMKNKILFLLELSLAPLYFLLVLVHGILSAPVVAWRDMVEAIGNTKWKYDASKK